MKVKPAIVLALTFALGLGAHAPAGANTPEKIRRCTTITVPGSYILDSNLTAGPLAQPPVFPIGACLLVDADFVTIDLNGFTIFGEGTGIGIYGGGVNRKGIAVRNGSITNFGDGLKMEPSAVVVERVRAIGNSFQGIGVGPGSVVSGNVVIGNGTTGIDATFLVAGGNTISGNLARGNAIGIAVACPSNVLENTATDNGTNLLLFGVDCNSEHNVAPVVP